MRRVGAVGLAVVLGLGPAGCSERPSTLPVAQAMDSAGVAVVHYDLTGDPGPSIGGWGIQTGKTIISVDPKDPFWKGFQVL